MAQRQFRSDDTSVWGDRYGTGKDGALTVASNTTFNSANASCSGTADSTSLTLGAASTFADGDLVLIHQTRGTGAGQWELNKITSGGGTTSLTLAYTLTNTYTDSGASQAQIVELKEYTAVTVNGSVTYSAPAWDQNVGGILAFLCTGQTTITGTISAFEKGFVGGTGSVNGNASSGEGNNAASTNQVGDTGGTGGGCSTNTSAVSGAGGGYATQGGNGDGQQTPDGGDTFGNAALTLAIFGGAGAGGCSNDNHDYSGNGGRSAGMVFIFSKLITITGSINAIGGNGTNSFEVGRDGGGASGGAVLLKGQQISMGSNAIIAYGGSRGGAAGGNGGDGRIHADYSQSISGSASPTLDSSLDAVLNDLPVEQNYTILI